MAAASADSSLLSAIVFLTAAVVTVSISKKLKLGAVLGYLIAGVLIGPHVLKLISDPDRILTFSELGVVFLLFVLGLELSLDRLWVMRKHLFGMGSVQMTLVTIVIAAIAYALDWSLAASLIAGFGFALSSTAFVLQILAERDEVSSEHGRASFGVLLFQDLVAVPVLALIPLFGAKAANTSNTPLWQSALLVVGSIAAVIVVGRYLLRPVFRIIANQKVTELFTAVSLLVVLATAFVMHKVGLSMGLGAFLAGVLLADSEYSHEVEGHIEPFKGLLLGLFFMAVGMSLDLPLLMSKPALVIGCVLALMSLQLLLMWGVARLFGGSQPGAILLAALLASGGEFAFVVFKTAETALLLNKDQAALLNVIVAIAMAATPLLVLAAQRFNQYKQGQAPKREFDQIDNNAARVIIAGFGRVGQIPARILSAHKIPYTVIDSDTAQVDVARRFGIGLVYYGDTTRPETLRAAKIQDAEVVVLALEDPELSIRTARIVKALNPTVKIIATARHRRHVHKLMDMGVPDAIRETYHSALVLSHRMLGAIGFSDADADDRIERFRKVDEVALIEQYTFHDDEAQLIQSAAGYREELERLFETDRAVSEEVVKR